MDTHFVLPLANGAMMMKPKSAEDGVISSAKKKNKKHKKPETQRWKRKHTRNNTARNTRTKSGSATNDGDKKLKENPEAYKKYRMKKSAYNCKLYAKNEAWREHLKQYAREYYRSRKNLEIHP